MNPDPAPVEFYELTTLHVPVGTTRLRLADRLEQIEAFVSKSPLGRLVGCWAPDFGQQNRLLILRTFPDKAELWAERQRLLMEKGPFLPANQLEGVSFESFASFPGLPPITVGTYGPLYEFRTYTLKIGGLSPTIDAWLKILPVRTKLSPLITAMHALDGVPRFIHIWAYRSHEERAAIRETAFKSKAWPAPGAPDWLTSDLRSEAMTPTIISPLR